MKPFKTYLLFSVSAIVISIILSVVFNFSLSNTWQAGIALIFIFAPMGVYLWQWSDRNKERFPFLCGFVKAFLCLAAAAYLVMTYLTLR